MPVQTILDGAHVLKEKNPTNTQRAGFWVPEKGGAAPRCFRSLREGIKPALLNPPKGVRGAEFQRARPYKGDPIAP